MVQTWVENDESSDGDTVKLGLENLENKLDTIRSQFGGSAFPTDADRVEGQLCWRTSGGARGVGMYALETRVEGDAPSDVWVFAFSDSELTAFGESLQVAADAAAVIALLGLGTAATLVLGTGSGEVQTNSQNEGDYLQITNDLSDLANAATARTNLGLGAVALLASIGTANIAAGAVTRTELVSIEKSYTYVVKAGTYVASAMEHVTASATSTDWTLTLPASPSVGEKVAVYATSIVSGYVITLDGGTETILGSEGGTTLGLYATRDSVELAYNGANWVLLSDYRRPHVCQISQLSFSTPSANAWGALLLDTVDLDVGGMDNIGSNSIVIVRSGQYRLKLAAWMGQVGPWSHYFRVLKDTVRLTPQIVEVSFHDHYPSGEHDETFPGAHYEHIYTLVAGEELDVEIYGTLDTSAENQVSLTLEEIR